MATERKALVTGGTAGLGRAFCDQLVADGYVVTSIDRNTPERDCGFDHIACDLSQRVSVDHAIGQARKQGPFDLMVFNAGISATGKFEEIDPQGHARVLAVNAEAPLVMSAALVDAGAVKQGGAVLFVSSLSHFTGYPGAASYGAAKDTVAVYAKSIRKPFKSAFGISVTCAFPGPLRTDHAARHAPEGADAEKRMDAPTAAGLILKDALAGKAKSLPGGGAKVFAMAGRLAPKTVTKTMRKIIYDKLHRTVAD